jgi:hypothetical protein
MFDTSHLLLAVNQYNDKLSKEKVLMKKASDENRENDRIIHYGNVRYLEGKRDAVIMILRLCDITV